MPSKIHSKQVKVGILRQQKASGIATAFAAAASNDDHWLDPAPASANFRHLYYEAASVVPDSDTIIEDTNLTSQYGIHSEWERKHVDSTSGLPSISFSGVMDVNGISPHLVAALQGVSAEGATGVYQRTIVAGGLTGPIQFSIDNGGFLHTIALSNGVLGTADDGILLKNAVLDSYSQTFEFNARGIARLGKHSGRWVGSEMSVEQTLSGTWVVTTPAIYNNAQAWTKTTFTVDGVSYAGAGVPIRSFTFNVNNNVTSTAKTTSGVAKNYDMRPEYTSRIVLDYDTTTEKIFGDHKSGATVVFRLKHDTAGTTGHIDYSFASGLLTSNPYIFNEEFLGVGLDIKWFSVAGATPVSIISEDSLDWNYI